MQLDETFASLAKQNAELQRAVCERMSPELARAWRTWASVSRLSHQLEMLRRQLLTWRTQQLREEAWVECAESVLRATDRHASSRESGRAAPRAQPGKPPTDSWGFA